MQDYAKLRSVLASGLAALVIGSCSGGATDRTPVSLAAARTQAVVLTGNELASLFGNGFDVSEELLIRAPCEPFDTTRVQYLLTVVVDGLSNEDTYRLLADRPGVDERFIGQVRVATFDLAGLGGDRAVSWEPGADGVMIATTTGCYPMERWGATRDELVELP